MKVYFVDNSPIFKGIENTKQRSFAGVKTSEGTCLNKKISEEETAQAENKTAKQPRYDILELKQTGENQKPIAPSQIVIKSPPEFRRIANEYFESFDNALENALNTAHKKKMSYGERMKFLHDAHKNWLEDKRQNDEEMFAFHLKSDKHHIEAGKPGLVGLPSDFTMEDYHRYVDKWEKIWEQQEKAIYDFWHSET